MKGKKSKSLPLGESTFRDIINKNKLWNIPNLLAYEKW